MKTVQSVVDKLCFMTLTASYITQILVDANVVIFVVLIAFVVTVKIKHYLHDTNN